MTIVYPTVKNVVDVNYRVLKLYKATKAERHNTLSISKIDGVLNRVKSKRGDLLDKASVLLQGTIQAHAFESANKRTAYLVTMEFLLTNQGGMPLKKRDEVYFLYEIREGKRDLEDIRLWLSKGSGKL